MNRFLRMSILPCGLIVMLAILLMTAGIASKASANPALRCGAWQVVPSLNLGSTTVLSGVTAVSANNVWAVGSYANSSNIYQTLIEHWNGTSWSVVPSPSPGGSGNSLSGVTAVSADNVWAVGSYANSSNIYQTLIEHWNGTSWSVVPSPNVSSNSNGLSAVTLVPGTKQLWATGYFNNNGNSYLALIEHWNGTSWSVVPGPNLGGNGNDYILSGVTAVSADNVWAVGYYSYNYNANSYALVEHWNGTSWSVVSSLSSTNSTNAFGGIARIPGTQKFWTVGSSSYMIDAYSFGDTLIGLCRSTGCKQVPSPDGSKYGANGLSGVVAVSANNAWAVGSYWSGFDGDPYLTLIEHWNGTSWSVVPSPNVSSNSNGLSAVTLVPGTKQLWAVGAYSNTNGGYQSLIEFHC